MKNRKLTPKQKRNKEWHSFIERKYGKNYRTNGDGISAIQEEFRKYLRTKTKSSGRHKKKG